MLLSYRNQSIDQMEQIIICIVAFEHVTANFPAGIYSFKVNTKTIHEICSKLTIKTTERSSMASFWCNKFHKLFWCFHYWNWTCYRLLDLVKLPQEMIIYQTIPFTCQSNQNYKWVLVFWKCFVLGAIFWNKFKLAVEKSYDAISRQSLLQAVYPNILNDYTIMWIRSH